MQKPLWMLGALISLSMSLPHPGLAQERMRIAWAGSKHAIEYADLGRRSEGLLPRTSENQGQFFTL